MKRASHASHNAKPPAIELRIRLDVAGVGQIGPGKIELLRQIREHQSIAAAARAMDMSYRRAWLLVQDLNEVFSRPVVAKWLGGKSRGGATLTRAGEKLVRSYDMLVQQAADANRVLLKDILRSTQRSPR